MHKKWDKNITKKIEKMREETELLISDHSEILEIFTYPDDVPHFIFELISDIDRFTLVGSNGYSVQVTNSINDISQPLENMGYYLKAIYDIIRVYVSMLNSSLSEISKGE